MGLHTGPVSEEYSTHSDNKRITLNSQPMCNKLVVTLSAPTFLGGVWSAALYGTLHSYNLQGQPGTSRCSMSASPFSERQASGRIWFFWILLQG